MRGSIQYPSRRLSVQVGLCVLSFFVLLMGSLLMIAGFSRPGGDTVLLELSSEKVPESDRKGNVYLLSEDQGTILQVGRFDFNEDSGKLELRMPESALDETVRWNVHYWHSAYDSYLPFLSFLNDERLRDRMSDIFSEAFKDPVLREESKALAKEVMTELYKRTKPHFKELTDSPKTRSLLIDMGIEEVTRRVKSSKSTSEERVWVKEMSDEMTRVMKDWPWSEWMGEMVEDENRQDAVMRIVDQMEPYFREAFMNFLWNKGSEVRPGPEYAPNVRLLWVARRTIFGAREPAITLMANPEGQTLNPSIPLQILEVL